MAYDYKRKTILDDVRMPDTVAKEVRVLADLIQSPELIQEAQSYISRDSFSMDDNKRAWDVIISRHSNGEPIDFISLMREIPDGIIPSLRAQQVSASCEILPHCKDLAKWSSARTAIALCYEFLNGCAGNSFSSDHLSSFGDKIKELATSSRFSDGSTKSFNEAINDHAAGLEADMKAIAEGKKIDITTGFPSLDALFRGGFKKKRLYTIAARPGCGKSGIMEQMALTASANEFKAVIYSVEMNNDELVERALLATGIIKGSQLDPKKGVAWERYEESVASLGDLRLLQVNDVFQTVDEICADISRQRKLGKCDIVFVDHLHHLAPAGPGLDEYQDVSLKVRRFKQTAKDCDIPVVLMSQLNRNSEMTGRPPELKDLRGTGSIEEVSDVVLMLEAVKAEDADGKVDRVNMWVRKNRAGKGGDVCIPILSTNCHMKYSEEVENQ